MKRARNFAAAALALALAVGLRDGSSAENEPTHAIRSVEHSSLPGEILGFMQDVRLYPTHDWLVRRLGAPSGHLARLDTTGLGPFDPTNHILTYFAPCGLRYSSLSANDLWEPDATVASYFESQLSDGWYFVDELPLVVVDQSSTPWLVLPDGTAVRWTMGAFGLEPHMETDGRLRYEDAADQYVVAHADGDEFVMGTRHDTSTGTIYLLSERHSRGQTTRYVRDGRQRLVRIEKTVDETGVAMATTIVWDDDPRYDWAAASNPSRPVRINLWRGPVGANDAGMANLETDASLPPKAPLRCELLWGAEPRRHLVGTNMVDESPNFRPDGSERPAGERRNEQQSMVYSYESGTDDYEERLKKILYYRGALGEAAPDNPLLVATLYISADGVYRGATFADNYQLEIFPSTPTDTPTVTISEGWPRTDGPGYTDTPIRVFHLRREGPPSDLLPESERQMVLWKIDDRQAGIEQEFTRDPDHLRLTGIDHYGMPGHHLLGRDTITPAANVDRPERWVRSTVIDGGAMQEQVLFADMTWDEFGRPRGGVGHMGEQFAASYYPSAPSMPVAGALESLRTTFPGGAERVVTNEMGGAVASGGLSGSDLSFETRVDGVLERRMGVNSHGRVIGMEDAAGKGLRFDVDPMYARTTSVRGFVEGQEPATLVDFGMMGTAGAVVTASQNNAGDREARMNVRDGIFEQIVVDADGNTLSSVRRHLGRRGETTRIERTGADGHTTDVTMEYSLCNQLTRVVVNGEEVERHEPRFGCQNLGETATEACTIPMDERRCINPLVAGRYYGDWESFCEPACECKPQYWCGEGGGCTSSPFGSGRFQWNTYGFTTEDWCR